MDCGNSYGGHNAGRRRAREQVVAREDRVATKERQARARAQMIRDLANELPEVQGEARRFVSKVTGLHDQASAAELQAHMTRLGVPPDCPSSPE